MEGETRPDVCVSNELTVYEENLIVDEEMVDSEEKLIADKEDLIIDETVDCEEKVTLSEAVVNTEGKLIVGEEEKTLQTETECKNSLHDLESDETNSESSPEKEKHPDSSYKIKPTPAVKIEGDIIIKDILPVSSNQPKTTEIILYPPSEELPPPKSKKVLVLKPEPSRQIPQQLVRRISVKRTRNITCTFIIIAILLCLVTGSYLIGGTWLFLYLEETEEVSYIKEFSKLKNDTAILLATELRQVKAHEAIWSQYVFKHLDLFEDALLKSTGLGYWRQGADSGEKRWAYPNTMFYSLSLITTTGYGSMAPRSKWGRTATVCYSLFGIPLMLSWLICMGHFFAICWSWIFDSICCRFCCFGSEEQTIQKRQRNKATRIKRNSVAPAKDTKIPLITTNSNNIPKELVELERNFSAGSKFQYSGKNEELNRAYEQINHSINNKSTEVFQGNFDCSDVDSKLSDLDHAVSIVFAAIFFAVYFVFGSAVFALIEQLSITDVLYFNYLMFVSMGPGCYELKDDVAENKIRGNLCYIIYLIFGYITLSMIFNLIYMYFYPSARKYYPSKNK
ncbi:Potassium channel subfamily K member 5 like protein [Argiope bruennichi]|uniref:Potassium channel subfamily K member 5 like protein n=1 Tax=Argiope bruennichi TaxID=94029 RepID=A0A8T0EVH5_ARGBR|nr:Potassium channel subfamily K member 5 like protein [Argiope bruennichi]